MSDGQKKKDEELIHLVKERWGKCAKSMSQIVAGWEESRLFYRGDQWLQPRGTKFVPTTSPSWRVRLTVNKFPSIVESKIASFLKNRPIILADSGSDEDSDIKAAKISELLLRYYDYELNFDQIRFDTMLWMCILGSGFMRVQWDPTKGRKVADEEGNLVAVGQPCVDVISPFAMAIEPGAEKLEDAGWCIVTEIMLRTDIESRWGVKIPDSGDSGVSDMHIPIYIDRESRIVEKERVAVHTMYERPTEEHPNGRIARCTKDTKLGDPEDLPHSEIQIAHFQDIPLPGELWPTSSVSQGVPLQLEINRSRSQLIENRNLCARPQIVAAYGAIEQESWDNRPGSIQWWDPIAARGAEPHYLAPPQVPQWVMSMLQISEEDLMDLTSRHEVSQGATNSNVTSGRQAAIYKGADDSRIGPALHRFERQCERVGRWLLMEAKANLSGEQIIRIVGANRRGEYIHFEATDVSDTCNIRYEIASQLPWARESQRQQIMYLNAQGKIDDQTMMELLEMPTSTRMYETEQQHKLNARYENEELKKGYFPPMTTDNYAVHTREHEGEANRPEFRARLIQEMQMQAEMTQEQAQIPGSMQYLMQHMEAHRKLLPAPQPQPPLTRVNLNMEKLITELAKMGPAGAQIAQQLIPYAQDLMGDASGYQGARAEQPEAAPGDMSAELAGGMPAMGDVGTPAGGMDGRMYQATNPNQPEAQPEAGDTFGGPNG